MSHVNKIPRPSGRLGQKLSNEVGEDELLRVLWSRGSGCAELAELLDKDAIRVSGNVIQAAVDQRASLLVARRFSSSFDVIPTAVPFDVDLSKVESVAALVSGGPHSEFAASLARTMAGSLSVPARVECAYESEGEQFKALNLVEQLVRAVPDIEAGIVQARSASEVIAKLGEGTLLVVGAPGGSFLQRQFFGPGARLIAKSSIGAIGVQSAPRRTFLAMDEPEYVSPHMGAGDAGRLMSGGLIAVVEDGVLIGSVTGTALLMAGDGPRVIDCMREPVSIDRLATVDDAVAALHSLGVPTLPVVDEAMKLIGTATHKSLGRPVS